MHEEITLSGSGGQGILLIGRVLAEAGLREGHEVVWLPSYGAEKRGGVVSCSVTISDDKIGALFTTHPTAAIAMTSDSLARLEPAMRAGGVLVVNRTLVPSNVSREDIRTVYVRANDMAAELGDDSAGNMVMLGTLLASQPIVSTDSIMAVLETMLGKNPKSLELNRQAFLKGYPG